MSGPKGRAADRGAYHVAGLGRRKQAVLDAGGDSLGLAVAMLETERMRSDYTYGDGKTHDAANFGIFKQNWGMIRTCLAPYRALTANDYHTGAALNLDLPFDVQTLAACQAHFGLERWFAGHRNGSSGLAEPGTADIANYRNAILWIKEQIDADARHRIDDTRFWVDVPAI